MKEYQICAKTKPAVLRKIDELKGVIHKSNSAMASPLLCILKGPAGRDRVKLNTGFPTPEFHCRMPFPMAEL